MKKIILIIIAINFIVAGASAQDNTTDNRAGSGDKNDLRNRLTFGLKAGFNYSNVYDSDGEEFDADAKTGLAAGAFLTIPIGTHFGVQPEVLFSQKGFKATGRLFGSNYTITRTTNYLDIPLLFAVKPIRELTLVAGPQYSYLLKQTNRFQNASTSIEQEEEFDNDNVRKNTLCFLGGADINLRHIVLGARAGFDILNNNGDGTSDTPRYKNVWYQFTLGYRIY